MELRVEDLRKSYGGTAVLQGVSFTAGIGLTRVTGSSGIGKTTLLRILLGLESPDGGATNAGRFRWAAVFQEDRLLEQLDAAGNLRFALGAAYDEARLLTEVAVFTDKANIDEELTRLRSHIAQFRNICREERVGRKLDFLVQEFNRECNTVCSKSNDLKVTDCGLALKNEIEKIREQVQNVE